MTRNWTLCFGEGIVALHHKRSRRDCPCYRIHKGIAAIARQRKFKLLPFGRARTFRRGSILPDRPDASQDGNVSAKKGKVAQIHREENG